MELRDALSKSAAAFGEFLLFLLAAGCGVVGGVWATAKIAGRQQADAAEISDDARAKEVLLESADLFYGISDISAAVFVGTLLLAFLVCLVKPMFQAQGHGPAPFASTGQLSGTPDQEQTEILHEGQASAPVLRNDEEREPVEVKE